MKYGLVKGTVLTVFMTSIGWASLSGSAYAEESFTPQCSERQAIIAGLASEYSEEPVSMGVTAQGTILEVLAAPNGSWTMIETSSSGKSCLVANGKMWQDMNKTIETSVISDTLL